MIPSLCDVGTLLPVKHDLGNGGAHRPARIQHVVADEYRFAVHAEVDLAAQKSDVGIFTEIVPVQRDVEFPDRDERPLDRAKFLADAPCDRNSPRFDADKHDVPDAVVFFDDLMRQAAEGVFHPVRIHQFSLDNQFPPRKTPIF